MQYFKYLYVLSLLEYMCTFSFIFKFPSSFAIRTKILFISLLCPDSFSYKLRSLYILLFFYVTALNIYSRMHLSSQYQQTMIVVSALLEENNFMFSALQCNNAA